MCPTVHWLIYAVSSCPMACELSVQQSNAWTVPFPTVQRSDSPVANFLKVEYCCVKLSNGWTVLCPIVQWFVNAESNCPIAGQLSVQLSNGRTVLCLIVQWSDSAVPKVQLLSSVVPNSLMVDPVQSSCPMVRQCCVQQSIHSFTT